MNAKMLMNKVRKWDENIWKLIVFAVTIIIAVGVLGTLAYFYNQSRNNAVNLSILTSTTSSTADLKNAGFCDDNTTSAYVSYTPISDEYTLTCSWNSGTVKEDNVKKVRWLIDVKQGAESNQESYKVNK